MYTPDQTRRIQELRAKALAGTLTLDEMKEGIVLLRQGRGAAHASSEASRTKRTAKASINSDNLLDELDGL